MIRAFIALPLPEDVRDRLQQVATTLPLRRVVARENMHLTLVFLDRQPEPVLEEVHMALARIRSRPFSLTLAGLGSFGSPRPRSVHAVAQSSPELAGLQRRVENAARGAGIDLAARRFVPHVTLARIGEGRLDMARLERALAAAMDFVAGPFEVTEFALYRSHLGDKGADYEVLAQYPLSAEG
jgi:RNA 2',3'-cyclic 3'-phosphodiesterase